jgi:hypothetical protein
MQYVIKDGIPGITAQIEIGMICHIYYRRLIGIAWAISRALSVVTCM